MTKTPQIIEDKSKRNLVSPVVDPYAADEADIEASRAPLMDHLLELRSRIITMTIAFLVGVVICYIVAKPIYELLVHPFQVANALYAEQKQTGGKGGMFDLVWVLMGIKKLAAGADANLISTGALEIFFTKLRLAMFGGIIVSFPVLAWQLYRFVAPGLYKRERMAFLPFLIAAPVLFVAGMALVYFIMLPMVLWFSLNQQIMGEGGVTVQFMPKVSEYLELVETLMIGFGLCFQLPIVITLLGLAGIVTSKMLASLRRYAILGIVIVAAIVTPPDPISQCLLTIPIVLLYEVSILCVKLIELRRKGA